MRIPRATYRLQFNKHFRLADALTLVPYLNELGVSHIYSSPLFKATPGSLHGYDVCDFNQLNPEIGSEADLRRLADALHKRKMGLILDIVPNHMGIATPENRWWRDVLARGRKSRFAAHFDIDWEPADKELRGKILVPILGNDYETLLKRGEFKLLFEKGEFVLGYYEHRLPIAPGTAGKKAGAVTARVFNSDLAALDKLIRRQHYQLCHYEQGDAGLNYRRFFAVSTLAAVRVENEETFEATHALLRRWLKKGFLDGLRVDHPDGLRDPAKYLQRLRAMAPGAWIVVEKILGPNEALPASWPVQGTSGYDFLNEANGVFIDTQAEKELTDFYASFTEESVDFAALLAGKKRAVLKTLLAAEWNRLAGLLASITRQSEVVKHFSREQFKESLAEVVACFPVYRSYVAGAAAAEATDMASIKFAVQLACENRKDLPPGIFAIIQALLVEPRRSAAVRDFAARFQQLTGAVMAKGAEDTAFYCFNRFVSLNEVGGEPRRFGLSPRDFHEFLKRQKREWPHTQLTTSTHDTKRSEDVRARLNALSEVPDSWAQTVRRWAAMNARHRQNDFPDRNAEYLLYQTLAGAWPISEERLQAYMEKATREAKQHTDWTKRNELYDNALKKYIAAALQNTEFTTDLDRFTGRLSEAAAVNSLAQTLIKLTAPGVPDIYQGCELWDFSLVDPDNRRPVDFAARRSLLAAAGSISAQEAWSRRAEGLPKLWLIQKALKARERIADFGELDYDPVFATGARQEHVLAFVRGGRIATVAPRFWLKLDGQWQDTALILPGAWRNEFTGETFTGETHLETLFQKFPVALLVRKEND